MNRRIKLFSCLSPSKVSSSRRAANARDCGYALLILMMLATVLLISLAAVLPSIYVEGQRDREEELIFRGNEYARAIGLFHRQFNRYPTSVKELLQTNGLHFLRRAYRDPMSRNGKWRYIHANASGVLLDSRTQGPLRETAVEKAQNPPGGSEENKLLAVPGEEGMRKTSSLFGPGQEMLGAFIVGVASSSSRESIRLLNGRTHYDEWEFLGVLTAAAGPQAGPIGQPAVSGQPVGSALGQPANPGPAPPAPAQPETQGPASPPPEEPGPE